MIFFYYIIFFFLYFFFIHFLYIFHYSPTLLTTHFSHSQITAAYYLASYPCPCPCPCQCPCPCPWPCHVDALSKASRQAEKWEHRWEDRITMGRILPNVQMSLKCPQKIISCREMRRSVDQALLYLWAPFAGGKWRFKIVGRRYYRRSKT